MNTRIPILIVTVVVDQFNNIHPKHLQMDAEEAYKIALLLVNQAIPILDFRNHLG